MNGYYYLDRNHCVIGHRLGEARKTEKKMNKKQKY